MFTTVRGKHIIQLIAANSCKAAATTVKPIGTIPKFYSPHPEKSVEIHLSEETIDMGTILPVYNYIMLL